MAAPAYFGQTWNPAADNATTPIASSTPIAIVPPGSMTTGMFVIMVAEYRDSTNAPTISQAGGQTWTSHTNSNGTSGLSCRMFSCIYNGTWSANPSVAFTSNIDSCIVYMMVFTGVSGFDIGPTTEVIASGLSTTLAAITTTVDHTLAFHVWAELDDNALTGQDAGWTGPDGSTGALHDHVGNQGGADTGLFISMKSMTTAGSTGTNVVDKNTADAGAGYYFALKGTEPTVTLSAPADAATGVSLTPNLDFTGTDAEGDDMRYNVQVDTVNTFDTQLGSGDPVRVQTAMGTAGTATFNNSVTAGNVIVVGVACYPSDPGTGSVTDNKLNSYTRISHMGPLAGANDFIGLYYAVATVGGSSFAVTNAIGDTVMIAEYSGLKTDNLLDKTSANASGTSTTPLAASITPAYNKSVIFGVAWSYTNGAAWGAGGAYTLLQNQTDSSSHERGAIVDLIQTTAAATQAAFTVVGSQDWAALSASFNSSSPLVNKVSGTDAGFTNTITGGDTDPFNSGELVRHAIQSSLTASTTYYWRVRGNDVNVNNKYGAWATTRSFTTASSTAIKKVSSVAYASIKKISGLAIASVKKVAGLT